MRLATTLDVLDDRPTNWPKPPPGFSTKRVLMPWHDYSGKRNKGRRDTKRRRQNDSRGNIRREPEYNVEDRLASGLNAGRAGHGGFTVEALQSERNAKNAEILSVEH